VEQRGKGIKVICTLASEVNYIKENEKEVMGYIEKLGTPWCGGKSKKAKMAKGTSKPGKRISDSFWLSSSDE